MFLCTAGTNTSQRTGKNLESVYVFDIFGLKENEKV
jgi:hypothetical protein